MGRRFQRNNEMIRLTRIVMSGIDRDSIHHTAMSMKQCQTQLTELLTESL